MQLDIISYGWLTALNEVYPRPGLSLHNHVFPSLAGKYVNQYAVTATLIDRVELSFIIWQRTHDPVFCLF